VHSPDLVATFKKGLAPEIFVLSRNTEKNKRIKANVARLGFAQWILYTEKCLVLQPTYSLIVL
jgi:hypothetical protein